MELFVEVLKISIPAIVVAATVAIIMKQHYKDEALKREQSIKAKSNDVALPLKLQAYERLVLLMERIDINNMLLRLSAVNMSVADYKLELMQNVTHEFEHNLSQQLYVSNETWDKLIGAKEHVLTTVNNLALEVGEEQPSGLLVNVLINYTSQLTISPTMEAIYVLKKEAASL